MHAEKSACDQKGPERLKAHLLVWNDSTHLISKLIHFVNSTSSEYRMRALQIGHASQRLPLDQFGSLVVELLIVLHVPFIKVY